MTESGKLVWYEIYTGDTAAAKKFYAEMFGWTFEPFKEVSPDYWNIQGSGEVSGGIVPFQSASTGSSPGTVPYFSVEDIRSAVAKATGMGATLYQDVTPIAEGAGVFAIVRDPDGNQVGLWSESG